MELRLEEFWEKSPGNVRFVGKPFPVKFDVGTWFRDAEKVAINKVRAFARDSSRLIVHYTNWSGANPDFLNGSDRKPKQYTTRADLYESCARLK